MSLKCPAFYFDYNWSKERTNIERRKWYAENKDAINAWRRQNYKINQEKKGLKKLIPKIAQRNVTINKL